MLARIGLIFTILSAFCFVHAETNDEIALRNAAKAVNDARTPYNQFREEVLKLKADMDKSRCRIYKDPVKTYTAECPTGRNLGDLQIRQNRAVALRTEYEAKAQQLERDYANYYQLQMNYENANKKVVGQKAAAEADVRQGELNQASLEKVLAHLEVEQSFTRLKEIGVEISSTLDQVDARIDSTILGAYVQDKMGLLLNSNVLCTAVNKRCKTPATEEVKINANEMKEIFPDWGNARGDGQYYDKAKSRRSAQ